MQINHAGGYPQQQFTGPRKVNPGVLVGVTLWRLLIVAFALIGVFASFEQLAGDPWPGLSLQASLFTAIVYGVLALWPLFTLGRSHEPATPWIRGGTAVLLLLVMAVYMTMLGGDVSETWSLFEHLLTPLVVFVDACFVSASAARAKWWFPFTWVSLPLCYLIYYIADGLNMYGGMLNPDNDDFAIYVPVLLVVTIALGFLVYGLGKLRGAIAAGQGQPGPGQPGPGQPQQQWAPAGPPPQQYGPAGMPQGGPRRRKDAGGNRRRLASPMDHADERPQWRLPWPDGPRRTGLTRTFGVVR